MPALGVTYLWKGLNRENEYSINSPAIKVASTILVMQQQNQKVLS